MKPVTVINRLVIKPGKMEEFIAAQRQFAAALPSCGLIGGRMYRGRDDLSAVLVSVFESTAAYEAITQRPEFTDHVRRLAPLVDSASPALFDEAYTTGTFG